MTIRLVLFDFDFTLVDASGCLFGALREGLKAVDVEPPTDQQIMPLIGITLEKQFNIFVGSDPIKLAQYSRFSEAYVETRGKLEATGSVLLPGVAETLEALKSSPVSVGIVSTGAVGRITRTLRSKGVISYFNDHIFGGASNKAEAIIQAAELLSVSCAETLYVGDRPDDGQAAQQAGAAFVGVTTGAFASSDFPAQTRTIASLSELPEILAVFDCHQRQHFFR